MGREAPHRRVDLPAAALRAVSAGLLEVGCANGGGHYEELKMIGGCLGSGTAVETAVRHSAAPNRGGDAIAACWCHCETREEKQGGLLHSPRADQSRLLLSCRGARSEQHQSGS